MSRRFLQRPAVQRWFGYDLRIVGAAVTASAALLVAGCGGGASDDSTSPASVLGTQQSVAPVETPPEQAAAVDDADGDGVDDVLVDGAPVEPSPTTPAASATPAPPAVPAPNLVTTTTSPVAVPDSPPADAPVVSAAPREVVPQPPGQQRSPLAAPTTTAATMPAPRPVAAHLVEVQVHDSFPLEVKVKVAGERPGPCHRLAIDGPRFLPENTIELVVTSQPSTPAGCADEPVAFTRLISLGQVDPGDYLFSINGTVFAFTI